MGYRTIKTAVGAGLAIWLASLLDLQFAMFAAIIVIMCIEKTKIKTLITMKEKFFSSLLSLFLGALFFELIGYNAIAFSLFILLFIPLIVTLRIEGGFVTSMVVLLHVYTVQSASVSLFLNEIYIIGIGMGIALLVNSVMPSLQRDIDAYKREIEVKFSKILQEFSIYLKYENQDWDGKELLEGEEILHQAKDMALQDVENHLLRRKNQAYHYFEMRENQLATLNQMVGIVAIVASSRLHVTQKHMFADFLEHISQNVHSGDTTKASLDKLEMLMASIRKMDLPKTREEFEIRANLFYLVYEMENYLKTKQKLFKRELN